MAQLPFALIRLKMSYFKIMLTCIHTKHTSTFCNNIVCNYKTDNVMRIKKNTSF